MLVAGLAAVYIWFSLSSNREEKVLLTREQEMVEWATVNGKDVQMQLGMAYFKGEIGIPQNLQKGCVWRLYYAAINGNNNAREFLENYIISKKIDELERKAIANGNMEYLMTLWALYYIGFKNIQRDERKAEYFLSEAAKYNKDAARILLLFKGIEFLLIFTDQESRAKIEELKQQMVAYGRNELSKFNLTDKEIKDELINMGCDFSIIHNNVEHR